DERAGDETRTHAERLPAEIVALLAAHGRTIADVDLFAVASGPGSFTGLRIGIATIQGLALVAGRPVAAVSALDAIAFLAARDAAPGDRIGVWMDAHRGEVFTALYDVRAQPEQPGDALGRLKQVEGPTVTGPSATLDRWANVGQRPNIITGDGAAL